MTRARAGGPGLLAVLVLLAVLGLRPGGARAAAGITEVGWWSRAPVHSAPEGGFVVANAPDAPETIAAVRVDVGRGVTAARLEAVEVGGVVPDRATLRVCPTSSPWRAASGGPYSDAPRPACDTGSVPLQRNGAASMWTANVTRLLTGAPGTASLMVLPDQGSVPGFEVRFARPVLHATERADPPEAPAGGGGLAEQGGFPPFGSTGGDGAVPSPFAGFEVPAPDGPAGEGAASPVDGSAAYGQTQPQPATSLVRPLGRLSGEGPGRGWRWGKGLFSILLAAAMATAAGVGHNVVHAPGWLGSGVLGRWRRGRMPGT